MSDSIEELAKPCVLAIGGLDPSGGAGLPADARALGAVGAHPCGVAPAVIAQKNPGVARFWGGGPGLFGAAPRKFLEVIAQNPRGVARFEAVSPAMLAAQLDNLLEDIAPRAVKIGMIPDSDSVAAIVDRLLRLKNVPIVVDPVFAPSNGPAFSGTTTVD